MSNDQTYEQGRKNIIEDEDEEIVTPGETNEMDADEVEEEDEYIASKIEDE